MCNVCNQVGNHCCTWSQRGQVGEKTDRSKRYRGRVTYMYQCSEINGIAQRLMPTCMQVQLPLVTVGQLLGICNNLLRQ